MKVGRESFGDARANRAAVLRIGDLMPLPRECALRSRLCVAIELAYPTCGVGQRSEGKDYHEEAEWIGEMGVLRAT